MENVYKNNLTLILFHSNQDYPEKLSKYGILNKDLINFKRKEKNTETNLV